MSKEKINNWVWTEKAEAIYPDRKCGSPVPTGYLTEGYKAYRPYPAWVHKGYVKEVIKC